MKDHAPDPLALLYNLRLRLREADGLAAARIALVNGLQRLLPFDQSVLWVGKDIPICASSIDDPDPQAPHVQQLAALFRGRLVEAREALFLAPADLVGVDLHKGCHGLFVPLGLQRGGILVVRPAGTYTPSHAAMLDFALRLSLPEILRPPRAMSAGAVMKGRRARNWAASVLLVSALGMFASVVEVPQTLLVPAEIVSNDVFYVKAPLDGVVAEINVMPGESVAEAQDLIRLDTEQIAAQLHIATAEAEKLAVQYEQEVMLSFTSEAARARAADVSGRLREKRAQIAFLRAQTERHRIRADQSGIVIMPDVEALRGRPVATGETLLQIANPGALEVDLWIPLATALPVERDDTAAVFLATRPLKSYEARILYATTQARLREDGTMGYRARAQLSEPAPNNLLGQQGVARIRLGETTLLMRLFRQPLVWLRKAAGV